MSIGDAFQAEVDQSLDLSARMAPAPEKPRERGLWRAAFDSLAGAGAKAQASVVELGQVVGPAIAFASDPSNAEALDTIKRAPNFRQNDMSRPFRDYEKTLRPDPVTAGEAEKIVYGAVGPMATLVGSAVVGGVPGILAAGAEAGFSQSEDLAQQGVDFKTRTAVGTLTAGVTAGTALLPMAGQTVKQTLGLYVAGGPGQFVAQQYATRKILETADYAEIAKQYDPFDPTGLALSAIIPAPFAAWGLRGNIKAAKAGKAKEPMPAAPAEPRATPEQADAAMAHNLTLVRDIAEATPPVARAAEVMRGPVTENPNFRAWFAESKVVDSDGRPLVVYHGTRGDVEAFNVERIKERFPNSEGIYFTTLANHASVYADSVQNAAEGFNPASKFARPVAEGANVVPAYVNLRNPKVIETNAILESVVDGDGGAMVRQAKAEGFDGVLVRRNRGDEYDGSLVIAFHPEQIKSAIGNSGLFDPASPSLTDPVPPIARPAPAEPAQVTKAKEAAQALQDSGKPLADFAAGAKLEPDVQNLLVGLAEAGNDMQRATRMLDDFARTMEAQPGRKAVDVAADVVEASREGRTVTAEPQQPAPKTAEGATAESIQNRIAELEAAAPDMVVRMSDDGKPVTLADEMARIRREAAEGTDTELGTNDAALLKVAADCALTTGAG